MYIFIRVPRSHQLSLLALGAGFIPRPTEHEPEEGVVDEVHGDQVGVV